MAPGGPSLRLRRRPTLRPEVSSRIVDAWTRDLPGVKPSLRREALIDRDGDTDDWHWCRPTPTPKLYESLLNAVEWPRRRAGSRSDHSSGQPSLFVTETGRCSSTSAPEDRPAVAGRGGEQALLLDYYSHRRHETDGTVVGTEGLLRLGDVVVNRRDGLRLGWSRELHGR